MKKRGFTLIELLLTIILFAIILMIAFNSVFKYISGGKENYYKDLEDEIKVAGMDYLETYRTLLPREVDSVTVISLEELMNNKYIDEVKDEDGNLCTGQVTVKKLKNNNYKYYSCLKCGNYYESSNDKCEYKENAAKSYIIEIKEKEVEEGKGYRKYKEDGVTVYEIPQGENFELPKAIVYYRQNGVESIVNNNLDGIPSSIDTNELTNRKEVIYYHHGAKEKIIVKVIDKTKPSKPQIVLKYNNSKGNDYNLKWTNKNIYAEYKSTDYTKQGVLGTGIDYYEISTDLGETYQRITGNNTLHTTEGEKTIYVRSVDKMGNKSEANSYTIKIDKKEPTCGLVASGRLGNNGWYTDDVTISYDEAKINGTGSSVLVRVNVEKVTESVKNKVIIGTITDEAGNTVTCSITVNMDKEIPEVPIIKATDNIQSNKWHTNDVTLKLSGASNISGNTYYYKEDSEIEVTGTKTRGATINWNKEIENKDYYAIVCSNAGLCSGNSSYKIKLDKTAPECIFSNENSVWTNLDQTITSTCNDNLSGCLDEIKEKNFIYNSGTHKTENVFYDISDVAGNNNLCQKDIDVYVDKEGPTIPTDGNIGDVAGSNTAAQIITPASGSTDSGIGQVSYLYLIKNDTIAPSKDDTNFTSSRNYTRSCGTVYYAYAIAVDGLGNRSDVKYLGAAADEENSYSDWSTCSKTCGGGTQTRTNACGLVTTNLEQQCNTQSCSYKASSREIEECPANGSYCGEYCSSGCALCYPCPGGTCGCEDDGGHWVNLYHGINSSCCSSRTEWYCPDGGTLNNSTKMCESD